MRGLKSDCLPSIAPLFVITLALPGLGAVTSDIYTVSPYSTVTQISQASLKPTHSVLAGTSPGPFVVSSDSQTFYTAGSSSVTAVSRETGAVTNTYVVAHGDIPGVLAISPDDKRLFVSICAPDPFVGCYANYIQVFDVASARTVGVVPFGYESISSISVDPAGRNIYVTHYYNYPYPCCDRAETQSNANIVTNALTVISVATLQPIANLVTPQTLLAFVISPTGLTGLGLTYPGSAIYEIKLLPLEVLGTLTVPGQTTTVYTAALSRNGKTLALYIGGVPNELYFLDTTTLSFSAPVPIPGPYPQTVAVSNNGEEAYVNVNDSNVGRIDVATQLLTSSQPIAPIWQLSIAPDGSLLALTYSGTTIAKIPEDAVTPTSLIAADADVAWLAISPDGSTLFSANNYGDHGISKSSTSTGALLAEYLPNVYSIESLALSPDGSTIYATSVSDENSSEILYVVNASDGTQEASLPIPNEFLYPASVAVSPAGDRVYVMSYQSLAVVDTATRQIIAAIPTDSSNPGIAVSPAGDLVYVSASDGSYPPTPLLDVIDTKTNQIMGSIDIEANSIVFSPDGTRVYVAGAIGAVSGVTAIDTASHSVVGFLPIPNVDGGGQSLGISPDGVYLHIGNSTMTPQGSIIATRDFQVVGRLSAGFAIVTH